MEWVQAVELSFFQMRNLDIILNSRIPILLLPQSSRQAGVYGNFISTTTYPIRTILLHMKVLST